MSIVYEVTVEVSEQLVERYVAYMTGEHVPEVVATGCFTAAEFLRASPTRFRQRYLAASPEDLERYLERHAALLREDYARRFPEGTALTREIWDVEGRWGAGDP